MGRSTGACVNQIPEDVINSFLQADELGSIRIDLKGFKKQNDKLFQAHPAKPSLRGQTQEVFGICNRGNIPGPYWNFTGLAG
jgi:hypothetical protein